MAPRDNNRPGSDGLPYAWLLERFDRLEDQQREQHQRLRSDINAQLDGIRGDLKGREAYEVDTRALVDRVIIEREGEKNLTVRRSTWITLLVTAICQGALEIARRVVGR